ncbi:hypothetical protein ACOMHN_027819 [Nucella lapillus]
MMGNVKASESCSRRPNVVLIVADDLGYGDLGCFGNTTIRTPHLDKLATQGVKLTHSVAAASMCTPSRAAFLTGRYPIRSGMTSPNMVRSFIFTASASGLPASEVTIGEMAQEVGYRTAFLGKWHQGWSVDRSDPDHHHPLNQGFDYFYGIPLTNLPDFGEPPVYVLSTTFPELTSRLWNMFQLAIIFYVFDCIPRKLGILPIILIGLVAFTVSDVFHSVKLLNSFMYRNYEMVEQPVHLPSVTRKLVKESGEFLQARHADHAPFLLIVYWLHVHTALETAPEFRGQSMHGPYGDAVEEMDWGVGQLMEMLERLEMEGNTLVYFTSDHGGSPNAKDFDGTSIVGGSNRPFSGGKGDGSTEGSFRVPALVRWPGQFPAGSVVTEPVSMMDVLPTLAELFHTDVTAGHVMDGKSLVSLLKRQVTVSPHEFLFHYCGVDVHAVTYRPRSGHKIWKLMFREVSPEAKGHKCLNAYHLDPPKLYELTSDPTASVPLSGEDHPQVVSAIVKAVRQHQDSVQEVPSQFTWWRLMWQPWNQPCSNFPDCFCEDEKFEGMFTE